MPVAFKTQYEVADKVHQPAGEREKLLYSPVFDEQGHFELKPSGKENLYESIQSHKDSVDIHVLLQRFANGDVTALSRVQGTYGDFTTVPKTYAELLNVVIKGESDFLSLPVETRAKFGHSYQQWLAAMDDMPAWMKLMGFEPERASSVEGLIQPEAVQNLQDMTKEASSLSGASAPVLNTEGH